MESVSGRVLRLRNVVEYYPKPQFYNLVVEAGARRRSRSLDERQPTQAAARRAFRSKSVDQRAAVRRDSVIPPRPEDNNYLAQANAMLTNELIRMKDDLDTQRKKIDSLKKQDMANQKLIEEMRKFCIEKDEELGRLKNDLEIALDARELDTQRKKIDSLMKQDMATQKLIEETRNYCIEKDEELTRLKIDLETALNARGGE